MYRVTRTKIRVGVAKERGVAILEGVALWREREKVWRVWHSGGREARGRESLEGVALWREREKSLEGVALWRERKRDGERVWRVWHSGESVRESVSKWGHVRVTKTEIG